MLQVWQLDLHGRNILRGYGFRHLPSSPGFCEVSVPCWRATGSMQASPGHRAVGTPRATGTVVSPRPETRVVRVLVSNDWVYHVPARAGSR